MKRLLLITGIAVVSFAQAFAAPAAKTNTPASQVQGTNDDDDTMLLLASDDSPALPDQSKQQQSTNPQDTSQQKMLLAGTSPSADKNQPQKGTPGKGEKADPSKQPQQPQLVA